MLQLGPAARGLIDCAAATQVAHDAVAATLVLKRLAGGLRLIDLAPPDAREELGKLLDAICTRTETAFLAWAGRRDLPEIEMRAGLEVYERCSAAELEGVLRELTPGATPRQTLENALRECASRCGVLSDDLIARDIGRALVRSALAAAEAYAEPLKGLSWSRRVSGE
jgi:hypothetical protein